MAHYLFRQLFNCREDFARQADRSPNSLISDSDLAEIAEKQPTSRGKLQYLLEDLDEDDDGQQEFVSSILNELKLNLKIFDGSIKEKFIELVENENKGKTQVQQNQKDDRRKKIQDRFRCKKDVYENCRIFGPDGQHLANCNSKKALWYVTKGLGEVINKE